MYKTRLVLRYVKTRVNRSIRQCGFCFLFLEKISSGTRERTRLVVLVLQHRGFRPFVLPGANTK